MHHVSIAVCCLLLLGPGSSAPGAPPGDEQVAAALDAYVSAHANNGDFSGVVLVTREGRAVYEKSFGLASRTFDVPNGGGTRFMVASVTKTFTAAAIALLEQEGRLKITDGLEMYLPEFAHAGKIKLWHLLAHQSGLDEPDEQALAARNVSPDELLATIAARPLRFEPGTDSRYGNAAYVVLARVVEKVSGQPFEAFLEQRIFSPLGMSASGAARSGEIIPQMAEGYLPGIGTGFLRPPASDPSVLYGSGNVYSAARDLDRWLRAIDDHELFDISRQPYPFGWGKRRWFERDVLVQSGIAGGYSSIILMVPAEKLHIVVLMNTQSGFTGDEGQTLLGIALGQPATPPARRLPPPSIPAQTLDRYAGTYAWGEGKVPMHIESDGNVLTLRWDDSTTAYRLTALSETEFLDRSSFGVARFTDAGLVWIQNGQETAAPRAQGKQESD